MPINEINYNQLQNLNEPAKVYENSKSNTLNSLNISKESLNNPRSDSFEASSLSTKKAEQSKYYNSSAQSEGSDAITNTYMDEIIAKGKEVPKPDNVKMDDVSWGMLVQLGEEMGLTDADRLSQLTVEDIEAYFYNKNVIEKGNNLLKENLTANEYVNNNANTFNDKEYWDMVFEAKAKNQPYSINTIEKSDTGLNLSASEFFSNKSNVSATSLSAASLHNVVMAFENDDIELFSYAIDNLKTTDKEYTVAENQKQMIESYNNMQEYAKEALSPYEQLQIIKNSLKSGSLISYKV